MLPFPVFSNDDLAKIRHINRDGDMPGFEVHIARGLYDVHGDRQRASHDLPGDLCRLAGVELLVVRQDLPQVLAAFVTEQGFNPWVVLSLILVMYLILGGPMDSMSGLRSCPAMPAFDT